MLVAQSCPTLCDPMDCSPPVSPLSMEFSRPEYWSGWPFPSPGVLPDSGIEPRSPALVKVKVAQSCPTLCDPMNYTVYGILQARILEWVAFPFSRVSSQPRSPTLQADSLPAEPHGKHYLALYR